MLCNTSEIKFEIKGLFFQIQGSFFVWYNHNKVNTRANYPLKSEHQHAWESNTDAHCL